MSTAETDVAPYKADDELIRMLRLTYEFLQRPFEELFKGQLTALQLHVLCELLTSGSMTVTELSERLRIPKQQMSCLISKMDRAGFVHKERAVLSDRRSVEIKISDNAAELMRSKCGEYIRKIGEVLDKSGTDRAEFMDAVRLFSNILGQL